MPSDDLYPEPGPSPAPSEMPMYDKTLAAMQAGATIYHGNVVDHRPTISEQLAMRKAHLEAELAQVNAAIEKALEQAPTMALLDSISKVGLLQR